MDGWNVPQPDLYGIWTTDSHRAGQRAGPVEALWRSLETGKRTMFIDRDNWGNKIKLTPAPAGRAN
ncbi:hypothetical protein E5D57_010252 [Metarhizium anisopliae]|nr:hypothetical protein E5D57_010252 [Metarhizium anisopliae]